MMIESDDPSEIDAVLASILNDDREVDFEKIVPMPPILMRASTGHKVIDGETHTVWIEEDNRFRGLNPTEKAEYAASGSFSWYDWAVVNWGAKWNASDTDIDDTEMSGGVVEIRYETPFNAPYSYLAKLRDLFPNVKFEFRFKDENDHEYPNDITTELETGIHVMTRSLEM